MRELNLVNTQYAKIQQARGYRTQCAEHLLKTLGKTKQRRDLSAIWITLNGERADLVTKYAVVT